MQGTKFLIVLYWWNINWVKIKKKQEFYNKKMKNKSLEEYARILWLNIMFFLIDKSSYEKYKEFVELKNEIEKLLKTDEKVNLDQKIDAVKKLIISDLQKLNNERVFYDINILQNKIQFKKIDKIYEYMVRIVDPIYYKKIKVKKDIKKSTKDIVEQINAIKLKLPFEWDELISSLISSISELKTISVELLVYCLDILVLNGNKYYKQGRMEMYQLALVGKLKCDIYHLALFYKKAEILKMLTPNDNTELTTFFNTKEVKVEKDCDHCHMIKKAVLN